MRGVSPRIRRCSGSGSQLRAFALDAVGQQILREHGFLAIGSKLP